MSKQFFVNYETLPFLKTSRTCPYPNRLNWRTEILLTRNQRAIKDLKILDLASHDGRFSYACLKLGAKHVTGVEARSHLNNNAISNLVNLGFSEAQFTFIQDDVFNYLPKVKEGAFDTILCLGFFYHTIRQIELVREIKRIRPKYLILDTTVEKEIDKPALVFNHESTEREGDTIDSIEIIALPTESFIELFFKQSAFNYIKLIWPKNEIGDWTRIEDYKTGKRQSYLMQLY